MKINGNLWIKLLALLLMLATLLPCFATTVVAVASETSQKDEAATEVVEVPLPEEDEPETDPTPVIEHVGEGDEEDEREPERIPIEDPTGREETMVGGVITTEDGYRIRLNKDEKSYTVVGYVGVSEDVEILASYQGYPITRIGDSAFNGNLTMVNVTIPESVTFVGERAFYNCAKLTYNEVDGGLYLGTASNPYYYFVGPKSKDVTEFCVHSEAEIVSAFAFERCAALKTVEIGTNVKSVGFGALMQCNNFVSVTLPFFGENGNSESDAHLGYVFGARTVGGNISYVPLSLRELHVMGGTYVRANALYGIDMLESLTLPFLGSSATDTENNYFSYIFGGASYEDNIAPQDITKVAVLGGEIGNYAFYKCVNLSSVHFSTDVTRIGSNAFEGCTDFSSVTFAEDSKLTKFDSNAFYDCSNLISIAVPATVTSIGDRTFVGCSSLTSITIPASVKSVGLYAFSGCTGIIEKENGVSYVDKWAIDCDTTVTTVSLRGDTVGISDEAFSGCSNLTSITIPTSVTNIGDYAFSGCTGIIEKENGVSYVDKWVIGCDTSVTTVSLRADTILIGDKAFSYCSSLTSITIPDSVTSIGEDAFEYCRRLTSIIIPAGVTSIGSSAFSGCRNLTSVTFGANSQLTSIGENAFLGCNKLNYVCYQGSENDWNNNVSVSSGNDALLNALISQDNAVKNVSAKNEREEKRRNTMVFYTESISTYNASIQTVSQAKAMTPQASEGLKFVSNGDGTCYVSGIGTCKDTELVIPSHSPDGSVVTSIEKQAFYICSGLTSVTFDENSKLTSIGDYAFYGCSSLMSITIPDSVTSIGDYAFLGCSSLISIAIPDSVTGIGYCVFSYCSNLTSVTFGENSKLTSIGDYAFFDCSSLTSITIPEGVTCIGVQPFTGCAIQNATIPTQAISSIPKTNLATVVINGGTSIDSDAFYNCSKLTAVTIPDSITSIGEDAFYSCDSLTSIIIPHNVTSIGDYAFSDCDSLTSIAIPASVTSIGNGAFSNCNNLISVTFDANSQLTSIGDYAFSGCCKLIEVYNLSSLNIKAGSSGYGFVGYYAKNVYTSIEGESKLFIDSNGYIFYDDGTNRYLMGYTGDSTALTLPASCKGNNYEIYQYAFYERDNLISVTIPASVTSIGSYAFYNCNNLLSVCITDIVAWCNIDFRNDTANPLYYATNLYLNGTLVTDLEIPSNVTELNEYAFVNCINLKSVTFAEGSKLATLHSNIFNGCTALETITYPGEYNEWRHIRKATDWNNGAGACKVIWAENSGLLYDSNEELTEFWASGYAGVGGVVNIPAYYSGRTVTMIYDEAFSNHDEITTINMDDTVLYIGESVFQNCVNLNSIRVSNGLTHMLRGALEGCTSLETLTLPFLGTTDRNEEEDYLGYVFGAATAEENGIYVPRALCSVTVLRGAEINASAFMGCGYLEQIVIPETVTVIEKGAFADCISLREFEIPNGVKSIDAEIFKNCNALETIKIGAGLIEIADHAKGNPLFGLDKSRSQLRRYVVAEGNPVFGVDVHGILYRVMEIPNNTGAELVKVAVVDVPARADLGGFVMPDHIVSIEPYAFAYNTTLRAISMQYVRHIGNNAFYCASALVNVALNDPAADKVDGEYEDAVDQLAYNQYIGDRAFMGCTSLMKIDIDSRHIVGFGDYAVADCPKLITVMLGAKVQKLGLSAFGATASGDSNLERFVVDAANPYFKSIDGVLYSINSDGSLTLEIFPAAHMIYAADGEPLYENGQKVYATEFVLPTGQNITAVQSYAFQTAKYLTVLMLNPENEMIVGDYAFANSRLQHVTLGKNVVSLGLLRGEGEYTVFADMEYLTAIEVDVENGYYSSDEGVLFDKDQRTLIKYPASKTGKLYTLPETVQIIASMAFKRNGNLIYVTVPSHVSVVGLEAFYACGQLQMVYFEDVYAPVSVMENAFTTKLGIEDGVAESVTAQIGYSAAYYANGENGEYGWENYASVYDLAVCENPPVLMTEVKDEFYAVVVLDDDGNRLSGLHVTLTDPHGLSETVATGAGAEGTGVAMFYGLFNTEGVGFALDFENPYALKIGDPTSVYGEFINPCFYLDEDMHITYVTLSKKPFDVSFHLNGGKGSMPVLSLVVGETVDIPNANVSRDGYKLLGWSSTLNGEKEFESRFCANSYRAHTVLYAVWEANENTIHFDGNFGYRENGTGSTSDLVVRTDHTEALPQSGFSVQGYVFAGWATAPDGSAVYADQGAYTADARSEVTLYAVWAPDKGTLKFNANGGTGTMSDVTILTEERISLPQNTFTRKGYTFAGWTENGVSYADGAAYTANAESTHVLYAVWTPNTNAVRFNANGGKGSMTNAYGKTDSTITLPKTTFTRSNYVQIGWSLTAGGALMYTNGGEYTVTAESETTLYAVWVEVPKAYGVSCGESDINSQTAQLNKAGYDYPDTKLYNQSLGYVEGNVYSDGMVYETERIAVIAYCDPYLSFFDKDGKLVDNSIGLYQNGVKVAGVAEYTVQGDSVIFYFEPYVNDLACEVDIEAWIVAEDTTGTKAISHTVLNIHVFDFIITGDDVELDTDEVSVDLSAGGEILKKLFGKDDLSFNISKNTKFTVDIQGDTVTLQLKGSKSKSKSYSSYKDGYLAESKANNKNTWYFTYTGEYKDSKDKKHKLKYNVRFARDHQAENYYYYQCIVYEDGKEVERFYGGVNGLNVKSILGMSNSKKSSRADVAIKARLIYEMHFRAVKDAKKVKVGYDAIYAETLKKEPNQTESSTKFSVELSGDLVFKYDVKKGFVPVSSTIKGTISVNFTHNQQFIVWIIPIVLEIDVDAKGGLAIKMNFDNGRNITMDEAKLTLNVDFGISAGVGCKAISGGVYGGAGTVFVIEFYPDFGVDSWKVNANFGVYIRVALWTKKWEIWSGNHYIIGGPSTSSASATTMRLAAAYLIDNYEPARGANLESGAQLFMLGDTLYKLSFMDVSALEGYDAYNYAKLTLSKWSGSYWEDPVILDEQSKTNDVAFTVYGEDGRVFVALTQQTERMTAELENDPYAAADNLAVKLVEITKDGYTVSCVDQKRDHYVYLPQYACVDGVPTMVWVENADNNMFGVSPYNYYSEDSDEYHTFATSANSVWMCRQVDGAWSEPVLIASGLSSVTDLALTDNGRIAYIVDADGDLADPGDRVLYYGGANGGFAVAEDPEAGCVTNLVADAETLMYYFDAQEDVEDGWRQLSAPINTLPEGLPADFVAVYNANGVLNAVLYHSTKYWTDESGERVSGSAIYGMFLENGVWGKAVELDSYEPVANLYVTDLDAEYIAANGILLYVELIDSESERTDHVTYIQQKQATLTVSGLAVDYAGKKVTFTVSNTGACGTAVYMSVNGEDNYMLLDEMLLSGHSATYTVALTGSEDLIYIVRIAETQQGSGCVSTEKIDLNYSDLRPFVKQLLIGGKDVQLLAVKNTGNMANTGITVIRLGQYAANAILTDEMVAQISELTLQPGVPVLVSVTNENGEEELLWVVEDTVEAGNILYHEIALSEHAALGGQNTLSVVTLPRNASVEKGGASANNTAYLTYSNLVGVMAEGETVTVLPELLESEIALDKTASADVELNYTAGEGAAVTGIAIGNDALGAEQYSVSAALVSGRITIKSEALKDLAAGTYVLTVTFADGTVCEVTLRVLKTYTVTWQNGTDVISAILVSEGSLPTAPGVPARPADKTYVYTFAGWSTLPNGGPESISAAYGDVTYYAVWRTDLRKYTVTWVMKDSNGDTVKVEESYAHGSIPAYEGTVFVPDEMRFAGWNIEILPVSGDVIYTAVYKQNLLMGDVNCDGSVNTRDLALLRQYVVGLAELTNEQVQRCNVYEDYYDDGSAKINTRDIALLQQYIVGVVDTLE